MTNADGHRSPRNVQAGIGPAGWETFEGTTNLLELDSQVLELDSHVNEGQRLGVATAQPKRPVAQLHCPRNGGY